MSSFRLLCLFFFVFASLASAQANKYPVTVKKIRFSLQNSPDYVISGGAKVPQQGASSAQKWVIYEVEFETTPDWVDQVTMDIFVLIKNGNKPLNLKGTATYQDIEKGSSHKVAMFMSPQTYKRYSGTATQSAIQDVAVIVKIGGAIVDTFSERSARRSNAQRWWEQVPPQNDILRSLIDTPWYPLYSGYYEQLKPK